MVHLKKKLEILKASFSRKLTSKMLRIENIEFNDYRAQESKFIGIIDFNNNLLD